MSNQSFNLFSTKDFYISSCFLSKGINLLKVDKKIDATYFTFNIGLDQANDIIDEHWRGDLKVSTRKFIESVNELKARLRHAN